MSATCSSLLRLGVTQGHRRAVERRAATPLLLSAGAFYRSISLSPARGTPSSKPVARHCCGRLLGQTNRQTPDRYIDHAPQCCAYHANMHLTKFNCIFYSNCLTKFVLMALQNWPEMRERLTILMIVGTSTDKVKIHALLSNPA